jgi:ABC-type nitrate/sulfonate/bicarbonate transport system substrate-binding protein
MDDPSDSRMGTNKPLCSETRRENKMSKRILLFATVGAIVLAVAIFAWSGKNAVPSPRYASNEKIVLGSTLVVYSLPLLIARAQGIFAKNRVPVEKEEYESEVFALTGLFKNEVEIATAADFVFVGESFKLQDPRVLAGLATSDNIM